MVSCPRQRKKVRIVLGHTTQYETDTLLQTLSTLLACLPLRSAISSASPAICSAKIRYYENCRSNSHLHLQKATQSSRQT